MTELDKVWKNCLRMWRWIAEVYDGTINVLALKKSWIEEHGFAEFFEGGNYVDCFFCEYVKDSDCIECPGVAVDESFDCIRAGYHYEEEPVAFYAEILRLDAIRTEGK